MLLARLLHLRRTLPAAALALALLLAGAARHPAGAEPASLPPAGPAADAAAIAPLMEPLLSSDFTAIAGAITALRRDGSPLAREVLTGIESGRVRIVEVPVEGRPTRRLGRAEPKGREFVVTDLLTGAVHGTFSSRQARTIRINNTIRAQLAMVAAEAALADPDPGLRARAAGDLAQRADDIAYETLLEAATAEQNPAARAAMDRVVSTLRLSRGSVEQRLAAIADLSGSLDPQVRDRLMALSTEADLDPRLRQAAAKGLAAIESRRALMGSLETLFFGLSLGSVLLLAAIGLAITFGVMGVINMAHGETIMLGAYTTFMVQQLCLAAGISLDWSLPIALPLAFLIAGGFGILLERSLIRHLYGRPLETLLLTFGVSLVLQQSMRSFVSANNVEVVNPSYMTGAWEINGALALTWNRLLIILLAAAVFAALLWLLRYSGFGRRVRAVMQNRRMAASLGINTQAIDALTFGLGSGIAGIAGVALSQIGNVGPELGRTYIIDSFMVVIFGGVGNLWGTLVGALSLGMVNKLAEPYAGAVLGKVLILVGIILFIQRRPRGLFALRGRAAEA